MSKKSKGLSAGLIVAISFIGVIVLAIVWAFSSYYSAAVYGNKAEVGLTTNYKVGRNIHGQFIAKLTEMAQVREMAVEDQERLIKAVFGQDGRAGNQASWQWVKENNPAIDISQTKRLGDIIESSRNKFENYQTDQQARCQPYKEKLGHPIDGMFLHMAGYPNKNIEKDYTVEKMCTPIESGYTTQVFQTGTDNGFQLKK